MEYANFIKELRVLKDEASSLFNLPKTHEDPAFRKWRHRVTALISAIEDCGYSIDCSVSSRIFQIFAYGSIEQAEEIARYNRDLQDTVNELETAINLFDKYGDPKGQKQPEAPQRRETELEWPQKITISWLSKHTPVDLWLKFVGVLIAAFLLGIGFAQTGLYADFENHWKTNSAEPNLNKEPNHTVKSDAPKNATRGSP